MAQLKPQPAAGAKSTVLMEQGQLPRTTAASKVAPTVLKTNKKVVTVAQANAFIELEDKIKNGEKVADKNQLVKAEDELNSNPALRALIKYLRKITYSEKYSDVHYEYRYLRTLIKNKFFDNIIFLRHVTLPRQQINPLIREYKEQVEVAPLLKKLLGGSLLAESEWREIGVIQRSESQLFLSIFLDYSWC